MPSSPFVPLRQTPSVVHLDNFGASVGRDPRSDALRCSRILDRRIPGSPSPQVISQSNLLCTHLNEQCALPLLQTDVGSGAAPQTLELDTVVETLLFSNDGTFPSLTGSRYIPYFFLMAQLFLYRISRTLYLSKSDGSV